VGHLRIPWTVQRRHRKRDRPTGHAQNSEAWRSFFALKEKGENANPRLTGATRRRDANSVPTSETTSTRFSGAKRSRLEIPVGQELKDEYGLGYHERFRLEVRGNPKWDGKQSRLELEYDEVSDTFRGLSTSHRA